MNKQINPKATYYNQEFAKRKLSRQKTSLAILGASSIVVLAYTLWLRRQSPTQIRETLETKLTTDPSLAHYQSQLNNEAFMHMETTQFTTCQLMCLTGAFLILLYLAKLYVDYYERDHYAVRGARQIDVDQYEDQSRKETQKAVSQLKNSQTYKEFTRQKNRWTRAEAEIGRNDTSEVDNTSLNGLIQTEEDSDFFDREFEKIDRQLQRVKNQLTRSSSTSNLSASTQPIARSSTQQLNVDGNSQSMRNSMGPPTSNFKTSNTMVNKRQTTSILDGSQSDNSVSRRSSQPNRR